jgi:hypothetical protein
MPRSCSPQRWPASYTATAVVGRAPIFRECRADGDESQTSSNCWPQAKYAVLMYDVPGGEMVEMAHSGAASSSAQAASSIRRTATGREDKRMGILP